MKTLFFILIVCISSITSVFASVEVDFTSDKNLYNIEDTITLTVEISSDENTSLELSIPGIEEFQVLGNHKTQQTQSINGVSQTLYNIELQLLAPSSGKYTIGPLQLKQAEEVIDGKSIEIEVEGDRIMINNTLNAIQNNSNSQQEEEGEEAQTIDDVILDTSSSTGGEIVPKKVLGIDGEEMTDIYPAKDYLLGQLFSRMSLIFLVSALVLIGVFLLLRKYLTMYLSQREQQAQLNDAEEITEVPEINYGDLINQLKSNYLDAKKEVFYAQIGNVLRTYLDDRVKQGLSKGSLQEVEKFLKNSKTENSESINNFYKRIYFPEYNTLQDSVEERKEILTELGAIIFPKDFQ